MKRKKVRKPREAVIDYEVRVFISNPPDTVILVPMGAVLPSGRQPIFLESPKVCRTLAKFLTQAAEYLASREGK